MIPYLAVLLAYSGPKNPSTPETPETPDVTESVDVSQPNSDGEPEERASSEQAAKAINEFNWALYGTLNDQTNVFYSPISIQAALGLAYGGATEETASEFESSLRYGDLSGVAYHASMGELLSGLTGEDTPYSLRIANRIWGRQDLGFAPDYLRLTRQYYSARAEVVPFDTAPDEARQTINRWVEEQTENLIKDLLPKGSVDGRTLSVLTNAIYFKGSWRTPFDAEQTKPAPFYRQGEDPVDVPLMHYTKKFRYAEVDGTQVVRLPYEGDALSMVVVLPPKGTDVTTLSIDSDQWSSWVDPVRMATVKLWLPKFEMQADADGVIITT